MLVHSQSFKALQAIAAGLYLYSTPIAAAYTVDGSVEVLQAINEKGPWKEPIEDFETRLTTPNATGNYPIAGPNISKPYSDSSIIDGWSWSVAVAADLPIATDLTSQYGDKVYTGGKLTFNAPESLLSSSTSNITVNDDWQICLFSWSIGQFAYANQLRTDDGSCSSVLSSECISDLQKAVTRSTSYSCSCPKTKDIPSCAALGDKSALWESTCAAALFNATRIQQWEDGKLDVYEFGGATLYDPGNVTGYDYIGSLAWPVMASFGNSTTQKATLSCLRASNATEGSKVPSGESFLNETGNGTSSGENSSTQMRSNSMWVTLVVALAAYTAAII